MQQKACGPVREGPCDCLVQTAERENNPRGINRHKYSVEEAQEALQQPVVQALLDLCRFRNTHPAFNGKVGLSAASACRNPGHHLCPP